MVLDKRIDKYLRVFDGKHLKYIFILNKAQSTIRGEEIWATFAGKTHTTKDLDKWAKTKGYLMQLSLRAKPHIKKKNKKGVWNLVTQKYWDC